MPRFLSLGLIAAFALVASACGASPAPSDDTAAGASTQALSTARVETVTRVSVAGSSAKTYEFRSTSIVDYANHRREDRVDSSGCRTITVGGVTYGELALGAGFPPGKHWVQSGDEVIDSEARFEPSQKQDEESGMSAEIVLYVDAEPTPDNYLDYLRENSGEPERVGEEDVRGVATTHYRGRLEVRSRIEADLETEDVEEHRQVDLWVDSEGLARRVVTSDRSPSVEGPPTGEWVTTTEFFDFGLDVDIQPPPAAEVLDSEEWDRIAGKLMELRLEAYHDEIEGELPPLPGAFAPSAGLDAYSVESSCVR